MPITWKNVAGRSNDDAALFMRGARESISDSFDTLGSVIDDRENIAKANYTKGVDRNTDKIKDYYAGFGSVEELEAAEKSGATAKFKEQFGRMLNADEVRGLGRDTRGALVADETADVTRANAKYTQEENLYDRTQREAGRKEAPLIAAFEKINLDSTEGNEARAASWLDENAANLRPETLTRLYGQADKQNQTEVQRARTEAASQLAIDTAKEDLARRRVQENRTVDQQKRADATNAHFNKFVDLERKPGSSDSQNITEFEQSLRRAVDGITRDEVQQAKADYSAVLTDLGTIATRDIEGEQRAKSAIFSLHGGDSNEWIRAEVNPPEGSPAERAAALTESRFNVDDFSITKEGKRRITTAVASYLANGITINGEKIDVTDGLMAVALQGTSEDIFGRGNDLGEILINMLTDETGEWGKQWTAAKGYKSAITELTTGTRDETRYGVSEETPEESVPNGGANQAAIIADLQARLNAQGQTPAPVPAVAPGDNRQLSQKIYDDRASRFKDFQASLRAQRTVRRDWKAVNLVSSLEDALVEATMKANEATTNRSKSQTAIALSRRNMVKDLTQKLAEARRRLPNK